ncbi:MAG: hypothetical protein A2X67_01760 [Ignavibacteria bacterium GWA2_55_11]|nr:MAG: hypothetical protein A2X67_01760 [Ignavibacteria bacterium GWA2_55_11]OGU63125.1 MAG: hypothetical protein A3C56_10095 [Ignavibacteria bacterium RIFCSPHIGHO2_02_FULL_56_12]OGU71325.1 MAG: hypothetical protein A3G43_13635 [Ignavibacteria bacterium RIFCSPLOWO2_12_FULL_56_21]OGU75574.1 MAG: hypothetical protein A3H45_11365 [Ignavibacteria bacterium RIFCSPLOWO2_02_FULL_55_14]HAV22617.1 hypothetical protein [Bacteroidota bacterium]
MAVESFVQFAQVLALLSASALCIYLIVSLVKLNDVLASLQRDVAEITRNLKPVLENLAAVAEKLRSITTKVDEQANLFKGSLETVRRVADNIEQFEVRIQERLEEPVTRVLAIVGGVIQKLASFVGIRSTTGQAG